MTDSGEGILLSTAPMERKVVQDISMHEKDIQKTTHETFDPATGNLTSRDIQEHIRVHREKDHRSWSETTTDLLSRGWWS